jgi:hypothetical protein
LAVAVVHSGTERKTSLNSLSTSYVLGAETRPNGLENGAATFRQWRLLIN